MASIHFLLKKEPKLKDYQNRFEVVDDNGRKNCWRIEDPAHVGARTCSHIVVENDRVVNILTAWSGYRYTRHKVTWEYRGATSGFLNQRILPFGKEDLKKVISIDGTYGSFSGEDCIEQYDAAKATRNPEQEAFDLFYGKHEFDILSDDPRSIMEDALVRFHAYDVKELLGMSKFEFFRRIIERKGFAIPVFPKLNRSQRKDYHNRGIRGDDIEIERYLEHINLFGV